MKNAIRRSRTFSRRGQTFAELSLTDTDEWLLCELDAGVRLARSASGETLFYAARAGFGQDLDAAVLLGWCRPVPVGGPVSDIGETGLVR